MFHISRRIRARAYFVKTGSVRQGAYQYDEPQEDDARVLACGKVPPVVYSEALSDLNAIVSTTA